MARSDKVSRFLPITFSNGIKVHRFGKHCPRCNTMVGANDMKGIASLLNNRIFVAAQGQCPSCHTHFSVTCVITDNKKVHRLLLPSWLFRLWLSFLVRNHPHPTPHEEWALEENEHPPQKGIILTNNRLLTCSNEVLGSFQGKQIPAWIEYQGQRFFFERAAPPQGALTLTEDELLFDGKLIYRLSLPMSNSCSTA